MQKRKKNLILKIIEDSQFDVGLFEGSDTEKTEDSDFVLTLKNSKLKFVFLTSKENFEAHAVLVTKYSAGFPMFRFPGIGGVYNRGWSDVTQRLKTWLIDDVRRYLAEVNEPDLWEKPVSFSPYDLGGTPVIDEGEFDSNEKNEIRKSLEKYRVEVLRFIDENEQNYIQMGSKIDDLKHQVNERVNYLNTALDRKESRFDWRSLAASVLFGVVTALSFDTSDGDRLKGRVSEITRTTWEEINAISPPLMFDGSPGLPSREDIETNSLAIRNDKEQLAIEDQASD